MMPSLDRGHTSLLSYTLLSDFILCYVIRGQQAREVYGGTLGQLLCEKADEGVQVCCVVGRGV